MTCKEFLENAIELIATVEHPDTGASMVIGAVHGFESVGLISSRWEASEWIWKAFKASQARKSKLIEA